MNEGPSERIAIVSVGGVFPGKCDPEELWELILAGQDCAREVPPGRWPGTWDDLYSEQLAADRVNSRNTCSIPDYDFDLANLELSEGEIANLDPMFRLVLASSAQAWRRAKTATVDSRRVSVILGNIVLPTAETSRLSDRIFAREIRSGIDGLPDLGAEELGTDWRNAYVAGMPASVVSAALGLGGGGFTLDAACASSLYALKLAVDELQAHRSDAVIAGGISRPDDLYTQMGFSQLRAVSRRGRCAPFDALGDGLVVGEGSAVVVLKRLGDATLHGDTILATIAGIGLSNDIGGNLMSPDSEGQLRAMRSAYRQASWEPSDVDLIECHGTGTPVGDRAEFLSLVELWKEQASERRCVIGSVKSNVGHMLTAAGAAGLVKVLYSLRHGKLPPTANFQSPASGIDLESSPFEVLTQPRDWKPRAEGLPRRAAVSAFGFGGINAHVLLEEHLPGTPTETAPASMSSDQEVRTDDPAVIVGMAAHFGPHEDLEQVAQCCLGESSSGKTRLAAFDFPLDRFRIPPAELKEMLPQQLLSLKVAAAALEHAGIEPSAQWLEAGVFLGIGLDFSATSFHFRWALPQIARGWATQLGIPGEGPEFERWLEQLREACSPPLTANRTMGALGGIVASRVARAFRVGGPSFTVSAEEASGLRALEIAVGALQRRELNVALVGAVDLAGDPRAMLAERSRRLQQRTKSHPPDVRTGEGAAALVVKRLSDARRDGDTIYAVVRSIGRSFGNDAIDRDRAKADAGVGAVNYDSIENPLGQTGAASGLAELLRGALSLYREALPQSNGQSPRYWLRNREEGPRRAAFTTISAGGECVHVCLEQAESPAVQGENQRLDTSWIVLEAGSTEALASQLGELERFAARCKKGEESSLRGEQLAGRWRTTSERLTAEHRGPQSRVAILVTDPGNLQRDAGQAAQAVQARQEIDGPEIFHYTSPLANTGEVALVFPGAGNAYRGMTAELSRCFPEVLRKLDQENLRFADQFGRLRFWQADCDVGKVPHKEAIFAQVWAGTLVSDVLAGFEVRPRSLIGYSLGESTALFAGRIWTARDEMFERVDRSSLFEQDLTGRHEAARRAWGWPEASPLDWRCGIVEGSRQQIESMLRGRKHVFLLIVNTPDECVIGGEREAVEELVRDHGLRLHLLSGTTAVHCAAAAPVAAAYRDLHLLPTHDRDVRVYSGGWGKSYPVTSEKAAEAILAQATDCLDFVSLIEQAYADGVRLFVEVGPGRSVSRMISKILGSRPHFARSACVAEDRELRSLTQVLAGLAAHGVAVQPRAVQPETLEQRGKAPSFEVTPHPAPVTVPLPAVPAAEPAEISESQTPQPARVRTHEPARVRTPVVVPAGFARTGVPSTVAASILESITQQVELAAATQSSEARAQEAFVQLEAHTERALGRAMIFQARLASGGVSSSPPAISTRRGLPETKPSEVPFLDRRQCLEFAIGSISAVLGEEYAGVDAHPTRVRLPDEPLMLVDRILSVEGEPLALRSGRVVTEHDVLSGSWYLDHDRIPTCIAVEAGQADLFLSGYLGIDFETKGHAVYRLLDAEVTFHDSLPGPGATIHYDIHIDEFFRQGATILFRFHFEATVAGRPLLSMRNGCAGFFTEAELAAGQGIVLTAMDRRPSPAKLPADWRELVPMVRETLDDEQVAALRRGDLVAAFGEAFAGLPLAAPSALPGGKMQLVHRVVELDPKGGVAGLGLIVGEADIRPDDWFLTCHFVDDKVMPGTLMYECCLHTLRIFLMRLGWVGEAGEVAYEPIPGVSSQLRCRGQVLESSRTVRYQIQILELGYEGGSGAPFVLAHALMSVDGRDVVQMRNMSLRIAGLDRARIEAVWEKRVTRSVAIGSPLFDRDRILAFAVGKPSAAFGDAYEVFDSRRRIARLPGPPYQFLDRIVSIEHCRPFELASGGEIVAEYDVPREAWYFEAERQPTMPFSVLLEVALQPCGWLAAYLGSALLSDTDLSFRNLGGEAVQLQPVTPATGTLSIRVGITKVARSAGMILEDFEFLVSSAAGEVYRGKTNFGFFSAKALSQQVGIRDADPWGPDEASQARARALDYPRTAPFPGDMLRMVDRVEHLDPRGGRHGLGFVRASVDVDPDAWFFKAHFHQDPVWPGSLGLESLLQLMKLVAVEAFGDNEPGLGGVGVRFESMAIGQAHQWCYRGQIIPSSRKVTVEVEITEIDEDRGMVRANGLLGVDGRTIYETRDFGLRLSP